MKKLLTIIVLLISFSAFSQVRPPIVTDNLQTNHFIFDGDEVWKDTLNYFMQISPTCYMIRHLDVPVWSGPFCFSEFGSDSLKLAWKNIWIKPGDTISEDDSLFHFRQNPFCPGC
jgi:hypothetical protein